MPTHAQFDLPGLDGAPAFGQGIPAEDLVTVSASVLAPTQPDGPYRLLVSANIAPGHHIYSLTQPPGGPIRTTIKVTDPPAVTLGPFSTEPSPAIHAEPLFGGIDVEEHSGSVTFAADLQPAPDRGLPSSISGSIRFQVCDEKSCLPPKSIPFTAELPVAAIVPGPGGTPEPARGVAPTGRAEIPPEYRQSQHVNPRWGAKISGRLEPAGGAPGDLVALHIDLEPPSGWHVYELARQEPQVGNKPTLIELDGPDWLSVTGRDASAPPLPGKESNPGYYEAPVRWTVHLRIADGAPPGEHLLQGMLGYQICLNDDSSCDRPIGVGFAAVITVGASSAGGAAELRFTGEQSYADVADLAAGVEPQPPTPVGPTAREGSAADYPPGGFDEAQVEFREFAGGYSGSLPVMLGFALLGGFILNFMPCVLPVIGLKILAFVEQSGHDRRRTFVLNLWYAAGLLSVFLVLAAMASIFHTKWGDQFTKPGFMIGLAGLVFVMALSFLGVWEIPIPGFVGGRQANTLQAKEGAAGAFAKGVFTTVLATPCSGPFLGPVFGFTLNQPPGAIFAIFLCVGLGMALPYLIIGAFPVLVQWLPKPGAWMDTFKQVMGFVLLGTVVFLFSSISPDLHVATLALLVSLWFSFWLIGRVPLYAPLESQLAAWGTGALVSAAVGWLAFVWFAKSDHELPWQPFSRAVLAEHTSRGKTVLVDFTALW